jgi:hypothetical protein
MASVVFGTWSANSDAARFFAFNPKRAKVGGAKSQGAMTALGQMDGMV